MDEVKKSMAQSLRELKVNDKKPFPLMRRTSVISTLQRLNSEGYRFKGESFANKGTYVVKKIMNPDPKTVTA